MMLSFCVTVDYSLFLLYQLAIKEHICTLYVQLCCKYHIRKKLLRSSAAWRSRVAILCKILQLATHGVIGPFDSSQEDWLSYIACLQNYFVANNITGEDKAVKRRAILLSVCGISTY